MKTQNVVAPLVVNGGANGVLTVRSTLPFVLGARVFLNATGQAQQELIVTAILGPTQLTVMPAPTVYNAPPTNWSALGGNFNATAYTVANSAKLIQNVQDIDDRAAYEDYLCRKEDAIAMYEILASGRKRYVQTIAFTTAASFTALNAVTDDGTAIPPGAIWVFQPDADAQIYLNPASVAITNTNSLWVPVNVQERQQILAQDTGINVKGRSATGNLMIFVMF